MEEAKPRPGKPGDRAQIAAEKLRALRQRANEALEEHRGRLAQIESELNLRVRQLADEFESTSAKLQEQSAAGRDDEVAALRAQLEEGRVKHEKFVEQLAVARKQLDAIQSEPCPACQDAANQLADAQGELRQLREKLEVADRQREEDRKRHEKFSEQVAAARAAIAELQSRSGDQTAQLMSELEAAQLAKAAAEEQVGALTRDLEVLDAECKTAEAEAAELQQQHAAALEQLRRESDAEQQELRARATTLEEELSAAQQACIKLKQQRDADRHTLQELQSQVGDLGRQLSEVEATHSGAVEELARQREQWNVDRGGLENEIAKLQSSIGLLHTELAEAKAEAADQLQSLSDQLVAAEASLPKLTEQVAALEAEKAALEDELSQERAAAAEKRAELSGQIAAIETEKTALERDLAKTTDQCRTYQQAAEESQKQLSSAGDAEKALVDLQQQLTHAKTDLAESDRALEDLQGALDELDAELNELRDSTCPKAELESLQQKFDLALADVKKLKQENGRLQDDLAARPATSDEEPPELVAMRVERDGLLARVDELEAALAAAAETAPSPEDAADLQRRFEMAVDDVRQLKQENAQLREQLDRSKSAAPAGGGGQLGGANDWAAQKARLLAMLEQEEGDGPISSERKKERARIEDAIAATDKAIADKERELAELRMQQGAVAAAPVDQAQPAEEILDAEPIIAAERERLAKLQIEWEEKLRAAELEFSVERAKLAREQAALKERMYDLQKLEPVRSAGDGDKQPRRRWLSALGLSEDGEEEQSPPK